MTQALGASLSTYLTGHHLPPSATWLQSFLSTSRTNTPLLALQKTALFRLLASDITTSLSPIGTSSLPDNAISPTLKELRLPNDSALVLQVLDIEDIGHSRWSQVENLEAKERGELTKGREIVRVVPGDVGENGALPDARAADKSAGPHKLLLQDIKGTKIYAFELSPVEGIDINLGIGAKILLRGGIVARGVLLLEPACVEVLGGRVDIWDKAWREGRTAALRERVGAGEAH